MDISRFTTYYDKKMRSNLTKKKRIKTISEYFGKKLNENISFTDERECFNYILEYIIKREDESEEILEELYTLLEYSYSTQNPNYVYDLKTSKNSDDFFKLISKTFKKKIRHGDFEYELTNKIKYDEFNELIECDLDYAEYSVDIITEGEYKKTLDLYL